MVDDAKGLIAFTDSINTVKIFNKNNNKRRILVNENVFWKLGLQFGEVDFGEHLFGEKERAIGLLIGRKSTGQHDEFWVGKRRYSNDENCSKHFIARRLDTSNVQRECGNYNFEFRIKLKFKPVYTVYLYTGMNFCVEMDFAIARKSVEPGVFEWTRLVRTFVWHGMFGHLWLFVASRLDKSTQNASNCGFCWGMLHECGRGRCPHQHDYFCECAVSAGGFRVSNCKICSAFNRNSKP